MQLAECRPVSGRQSDLSHVGEIAVRRVYLKHVANVDEQFAPPSVHQALRLRIFKIILADRTRRLHFQMASQYKRVRLSLKIRPDRADNAPITSLWPTHLIAIGDKPDR